MEKTDHSKKMSFPIISTTPGTVNKEVTCPSPTEKAPQETTLSRETHKSGCMVCGSELVYFDISRDKICYYCGRLISADAMCINEHFVCDSCHTTDAVEIIKQVCLHSHEIDSIILMQTIRSHPHFRIHGPEHHSLVPAVILTSLRNNGHNITDAQIITGIQRGQTISGGACAFMGACGAAIGVGIAVSVLLSATPHDGHKRQIAQRATQRALERIASYPAPRCCQRDSWLALQECKKLLQEWLGISLIMNESISCNQFPENKECIHDNCPLWPREAQKHLLATLAWDSGIDTIKQWVNRTPEHPSSFP